MIYTHSLGEEKPKLRGGYAVSNAFNMAILGWWSDTNGDRRTELDPYTQRQLVELRTILTTFSNLPTLLAFVISSAFEDEGVSIGQKKLLDYFPDLEGPGRAFSTKLIWEPKYIARGKVSGGRAGVSKASGFIMRKMAEASKSGYKTAPKGFDYKKLANKAQSGINEPTAKNSLRSTYGASPFIAKYFSGLQNPPKNETIAQKNARLHLLADYLLRLSQNLVKQPTEANIAQAEKAVLNRQPPALREHFANQSGPTLEITEEPLAVAPTRPNPAKHTKASLNALSTQQIRDILFALQGRSDKVGKKNKYSATPGKGQHKNKGDVIDEVLRIQGSAPIAEALPQNELIMDTGVMLSKAELDAINELEGMGKYRGGGPLEDMVKTIEKIIAKGGIPEAKLKYLRDAVAVAGMLGETELKRKVLKAMKEGEFEPLATEEKEEVEETGEPDKKLANIVVQIKELVSKPTDVNLPEMEEDEEPLKIDEADLTKYFGLFGDDPFYNYDYINYAKGNYNRFVVEGVCKEYKEEGFIAGITTVGVLQKMEDNYDYDIKEIAGIIASGNEEKAKSQITKDVSKVKGDMVIYINNFKEYNSLYNEAVDELHAYADKLEKPAMYDGEEDIDITDVENFMTKKYVDNNTGKYSLFWDDSSPNIEYHEALLNLVVEEWNKQRELNKINPDAILLAFRAKKDYLINTIVYDRYIEDFNVVLECLEAFLVDSRRLAKVENIAEQKKPKVKKPEKSAIKAGWRGPAFKGRAVTGEVDFYEEPEKAIEERLPSSFMSNSGAKTNDTPSSRRPRLLRWFLSEYAKRRNFDIHFPSPTEALAYLTKKYEEDKENNKKKPDDYPKVNKVGLNISTIRQDLLLIKNVFREYLNEEYKLDIPEMGGRDKRLLEVQLKSGTLSRETYDRLKGKGLVMKGI